MASHLLLIHLLIHLVSAAFAWSNNLPTKTLQRLSQTSSVRYATVENETTVEGEEPGTESLDQYEFTTNSKKQLVFDENLGRFFETNLETSATETDSLSTSRFAPEYRPDIFSFSSGNNEMVETKYMFANSKYKDEKADEGPTELVATTKADASSSKNPSSRYPHTDVLLEVLEGDRDSSRGRSRRRISQEDQSPTKNAVQVCYDAWNMRDMKQAVDCFADSFRYEDAQYLGAFVEKRELMNHFEGQAKLLPPNAQIVVDHMVFSSASNQIATEWHVEIPASSSNSYQSLTVPYTRGCSFYNLDAISGKIEIGMRVSEMLIKPSTALLDGLLGLASPGTGTKQTNVNPSAVADSSSIIEKYFNAWNERDMDTALSYFVEDCIYGTEDPAFVTKLVGKNELRNHLEKNAAVLPESCRIVLDDVVADDSNGKFGVKWHIALANGSIAIPNLRGCSIYTTDLETGLLQTGYDVTEAPLKLPKSSLPFLEFPARQWFGQ